MRLDVEYTDRLAELVLAKVQTLEQLCELARQQSAITQTGDATILLSFLARKQPLMDRLQEVQELLAEYEDDDPELRVWRSVDHRSARRVASDRCQSLLAEIVLLERQSLDEMSERRDALAAQLQDTGAARHAAGVYHSADAIAESTLDLSNG